MQELLTNWSRIREAVGSDGTYLFGSTKRLFHGMDSARCAEWLRTFREQAQARHFQVRIEGGHLYLDASEETPCAS